MVVATAASLFVASPLSRSLFGSHSYTARNVTATVQRFSCQHHPSPDVWRFRVPDAGADRAARTSRGHQALHLAAENGHTETVRMLLDNQADPNAKDEVMQAPQPQECRPALSGSAGSRSVKNILPSPDWDGVRLLSFLVALR